MKIDLPILDQSSVREPNSGEIRAWRSRADLAKDEEFESLNKGEFAPGALDKPSESNRRDFMKVMAASAALAGLTSCRRPVEKILPYTRKPDEVVPGLPLHYATAMPLGGVVEGLLITSREGRPIKVEGNPEHPVSQGATSAYAQASILSMYDPDRSKRILSSGAESDWGSFLGFVREQGLNSAPVAVIAQKSSSPTLAGLREQLLAGSSGSVWIDFDEMGRDNEALGIQSVFDRPYRPVYDFSKARVVLSLDADFLGMSDLNVVANSRGYAASRRVDDGGSMGRLYVVESGFTMTGGRADNRMRVKPSGVASFAAAVASRLGVVGDFAAGSSADAAWVDAVVSDLRANQGAGIAIAGAHMPPEVHAICAAINQSLGNVGSTVSYVDTGAGNVQDQERQIATLVSRVNSGAIGTIVILGANPVYSLGPDSGFIDALAQVPRSIHVGLYVDETAAACNWHIPATHYLEAWGDGRAYDGTLSVVQPLIAPLYDGHSDVEVVNVLANGTDVSGYDLVRSTWRPVLQGDFESSWQQALHDGFVANTTFAAASVPSVSGSIGSPVAGMNAGGLEVVFKPGNAVRAGEYSNLAWMQELPDPTTKVVWDNVALMSPATRERLGLGYRLSKGRHQVELASITVNGNSITIPVWEVSGHADDTITLSLGYGRDILSPRKAKDMFFFDVNPDVYNQGHPIANGVGVNVNPLRSLGGMQVASGASVSGTGETYMVASTQDHGSLEGRPFYQQATLAEFQANPAFVKEGAIELGGPDANLEPWDEYPELWVNRHPADQPEATENKYHEHQWGMVLDLNDCTGCNACVVACQSENNIQVVGKDQVARGREMSWIRVDRYFTGDDPDNPGMVSQPMMCVHCENAPCEAVCPVAATVHSPDGINVMVYNRCIGTRYCANNCPYKVRRFNYFNWTVDMPKSLWMAQNPSVTVRFRGVMEKCSYCVHRIRETNIRDEVDGTNKMASLQTACQQACPTGSIRFGDLADAQSDVSKARQNPRNYAMLEELNVKPRTSYLADVRNPNPALGGVA